MHCKSKQGVSVHVRYSLQSEGKVAQLCLILAFMDYSLHHRLYTVPGIFKQEYQGGFATFPSLEGSSRPKGKPQIPKIAVKGGFALHRPPGKPLLYIPTTKDKACQFLLSLLNQI